MACRHKQGGMRGVLQGRTRARRLDTMACIIYFTVFMTTANAHGFAIKSRPQNLISNRVYVCIWGSLADFTHDFTNVRAGHSALRYSVAAAETGRGGTTGIAGQKRREDTSSGHPPHKPRPRQTGKRGLGRTAVRASRPLFPRPPRGTKGSTTGTEGA